jgi:hypothetical protein
MLEVLDRRWRITEVVAGCAMCDALKENLVGWLADGMHDTRSSSKYPSVFVQ